MRDGLLAALIDVEGEAERGANEKVCEAVERCGERGHSWIVRDSKASGKDEGAMLAGAGEQRACDEGTSFTRPASLFALLRGRAARRLAVSVEP